MQSFSARRWVLIADDDADHRILLSSVIRRAGFDVREARDGQEVLDIMHEHGRPACVVTDLMMPRLSGFGVLEQLRESEPGLPIVLISAVGDDAMRTLAVDLGAAAMLHKPFDFSALRELVVRVADRPTRPH
jgi:DNA-binding response OmpR family regulator